MVENYSDQWMCQHIPYENESIVDEHLLALKNIFFSETNVHAYSFPRLIWLSRWLGGSKIFEENTVEQKRLKFLIHLWKRVYFHPFMTTKDAVEKIQKNPDIYLIGMSSTVPGMLRISYWTDQISKDGRYVSFYGSVKHRRIHVNLECTNNMDNHNLYQTDQEIIVHMENFDGMIDRVAQKYCNKNTVAQLYIKT